MTNTKIKSRIPVFKNYEEEALFWDTHSTADFKDEFKPIRVRVAKNLSHSFNIRLDIKTIETLRKKASEKGMGPTQLVRMWILEHINALS